MGAYHTLSLELQRKFTLTKENWDAIALERVEEACDSGTSIVNFVLSVHLIRNRPLQHNPSDRNYMII